MGAPNGLPSAAEVTDAVRDLQVEVHGLTSMARQEWGVASFAGTDTEGRPLELAVYGRDAADAQWLRKVWRFCIYRDSGPTLVLNRLQQVEHEAYLTFLAAHAGTQVPEIVAAGRCGPAHDAALVTRLPEGRRFSQLEGDEVSDDDVDGFLRSVLVLRKAGISHGALSPETVLAHGAGPAVARFPARLVVGAADADRRRPGGGGGGRRGRGRHRSCRGLHLPGARHRDDPGRPHPTAALHAGPRDRAHGRLAEGPPQDAARDRSPPPPGSRSRSWSRRSGSAGRTC